MARSKYNVSSKTENRTYDNIVFDSEIEMKFYKEYLLPLYQSGEIVSYELQKEYILQPKFKHQNQIIQPIKYVADFFMVFKDGHEEIVDTKGFPDSIAKLKRKMFWYMFPDLNYRWIKWVKKYGGWIEYEEYQKRKREDKKKKLEAQKAKEKLKKEKENSNGRK